MGDVSAHFERNREKWNRRSETFDDKSHDWFRWLAERLFRLMPLKSGMYFLDIGCGTGRAVVRVHDLLDGDGIFNGIDLAPKMIERAAANSLGRTSVHFQVASSDGLPFADNSIDVCMCSNSFHHYPRPILALQEMRRVLKPGGSVFILDVTADAFFVRWIDHRVKATEAEHVRFYSTKEFKRMFGEAGLGYEKGKWIAFPEKVHIGKKVKG